MAQTRYTVLSPTELAEEFSAVARDAAASFGRLDRTPLNWQSAAASWSVAQCLDHLLKTNQGMLQAMGRALDRGVTPTMWQRLPLWPRLFGWMLITSQAPGGRRKFTAPAAAQPAASAIAPDVVDRFIACQHTMTAALRPLGAADLRRVMVSPFAAQITYSVLDGYRLIAAHQRRHCEQALRVMAHPQFPRS